LPGSPAILAISHDPVVAEGADRVYTLRDGRIVEPAPADTAPAAASAASVAEW
jgi:ABC-type dipeptide/oligopeptide/nickel transport system ATPase component